MFSRPEANESESDLLRFQEEFIAGRLNPSATVVRSYTREQPRSSSPGDKRDSPCRTQVERDVVTLDGRFYAPIDVKLLGEGWGEAGHRRGI